MVANNVASPKTTDSALRFLFNSECVCCNGVGSCDQDFPPSFGTSPGFVLANATILAQQIRLSLSPSSYTEEDFQLLDTRSRVAMLLWLASTNRPVPPAVRSIQSRRRQRPTQTQSNGRSLNGQSKIKPLPAKKASLPQ